MARTREWKPFGGIWSGIIAAFVTEPADIKECMVDIIIRHTDELNTADAWYRRAMEYLDELDDATLYNGYAWFLAEERRDAESARPLIEKALAKDSSDGYYLDTYGYVLLLEGRHDEAAGFFEKALATDAFASDERPIIEGHLEQARRGRRN